MKPAILACFIFFSLKVSAAVEKYDSIIYLLTGGPFEAWNPQYVLDAWDSLKQSILETHKDKNIFIQRIHQSQKDAICTNIIALKAQSPSAIVILMGHSYGGHSSVQISRCLQEKNIQVDLLVTSDTVSKHVVELDTAHNIPSNVVNNFHYYEDGDPVLYGTSHNYQTEPGCRIRNFLQTLGFVPFKAHMEAISNLVDYKILQALADGALRKMTPDELDSYVAPVNAPYFAKYPVHKPWDNPLN